MSQTVKRGGKSVRKTAAAQGKARQVRAAKARTGSAMDAVMSWIPFTEAQLHRIFLFAILALALVLVWMVARVAGVPAFAQQQLAAISHDAGFEVKRVEVTGTENLNELKVYQLALAADQRAMPLVDIHGLRSRLLELAWVEDARVSRQLPDTLAIDIVERKPAAVLRKADKYVLIDASGHELQAESAARAKGKLVIGGMGAGQQVAALNTLLDAAPALKPQVAEAEWVGNRRWNLTFKTGQVLALPQGEKAAPKALMTFARLDGVNRLLGGKVTAFDMRAADRIYFRLANRTDAIEVPQGAATTAKAAAPARTASAAETPKPKGDAAAAKTNKQGDTD